MVAAGGSDCAGLLKAALSYELRASCRHQGRCSWLVARSSQRFLMKKELVELKINGRMHELAIEPSALLLDVLRQDLGLTGSKRGCDESSCGACTVLVDGVAMMSCTLLAASCQEQEITTVEGVSEHGSLAAIQKAYGDWGGAQCGFCTPGFIMTVKSLMAENPDPSEAEVRTALSSNLCRCTGYSQMYAAIRSAIAAEREGLATR
jgi:aerobic-type carbon monoxide dehydrogenase small subunit (CoxS/CutS family)